MPPYSDLFEGVGSITTHPLIRFRVISRLTRAVSTFFTNPKEAKQQKSGTNENQLLIGNGNETEKYETTPTQTRGAEINTIATSEGFLQNVIDVPG